MILNKLIEAVSLTVFLPILVLIWLILGYILFEGVTKADVASFVQKIFSVFKPEKKALKPVAAKPVVKETPKLVVEVKAAPKEEKVVIKSLEQVNQQAVDQIKQLVAKEESMDDVKETKEAKLFESKTIYGVKVNANTEFYTQLKEAQKQEFKRLFIDEGNDHLATQLQYKVGANNDNFFDKLYNYIYRYRRSISLPLLTSLLEEGLRLSKDDVQSQSNVFEACIRTAYTRRANTSFLEATVAWSQRDVELHDNELKTKDKYAYSYKRLAIVLEKQGRFDEAILLVEKALSKGLLDETVGEYPERLERLKAQKLIEEAKAKALFVEKVLEPVVVDDEEEVVEVEENTVIDLSEVSFENSNFYESLTVKLQREFDALFVLPGEKHVVKSLQYTHKQNNDEFFQTVFNQIYKYRKIISFELLETLHEELAKKLSTSPNLLTLIHEAAIKVFFYRRKEVVFLDRCEEICQEDIALHLDVLKTRSGFVYSYKRLTILLERQGLFEDAIAMSDRAIALNFDDKTKGNYRGRKQRLLKRLDARKG